MGRFSVVVTGLLLLASCPQPVAEKPCRMRTDFPEARVGKTDHSGRIQRVGNTLVIDGVAGVFEWSPHPRLAFSSSDPRLTRAQSTWTVGDGFALVAGSPWWNTPATEDPSSRTVTFALMTMDGPVWTHDLEFPPLPSRPGLSSLVNKPRCFRSGLDGADCLVQENHPASGDPGPARVSLVRVSAAPARASPIGPDLNQYGWEATEFAGKRWVAGFEGDELQVGAILQTRRSLLEWSGDSLRRVAELGFHGDCVFEQSARGLLLCLAGDGVTITVHELGQDPPAARPRTMRLETGITHLLAAPAEEVLVADVEPQGPVSGTRKVRVFVAGELRASLDTVGEPSGPGYLAAGMTAPGVVGVAVGGPDGGVVVEEFCLEAP